MKSPMKKLSPKKTKILFLAMYFITFWFINTIRGQAFCQIPTTQNVASTSNLVSCPFPSSPNFIDKYRLQQTYIPSSNSPLITLNITLHIFTDTLGNGQWENTNSTYNGVVALNNMLSAITNDQQDRFSNPRNATYQTSFIPQYIYDSKTRYEVTNIYFYPNTYLYTLNDDNALFTHIQTYFPERLNEGMPIVINASGGPGHLSGWNGAPAVVTTAGPGFLFPFLRSHLKHEIGHCLSLGHTYPNVGGAGAD